MTDTTEPVLEVDPSLERERIWSLMASAQTALLEIAPERLDQLKPHLSGLTLRLTNSDAATASAHAGRREIVFTRSNAEWLWLAAIAFVSVSDLFEEQLAAGNRRLVLDFSGRAASAVVTLFPAFRGAAADTRIDWKVQEPRTALVTPDSPMLTRASEMARFAMGFVLRHELAHVIQQHLGDQTNDNQWTLDEEKDADNEAIHEIFANCPADPWIVAKRAWAIVIPTAFLTGLWFWKARHAPKGYEAAQPEKQKHPQPYDRLAKALEHQVVARNRLARETMYKLAVAALGTQLVLGHRGFDRLKSG